MNKRESAKRIYTALESIDTELLYDARAYHAPKIKPYLRYVVAAVIALALLTSALILISAKTVTDYVTIDTNYGATLELNCDRRIVKAKAASSMYHHTAQACTNLKYQEAAAQLIDKMGERGGLSKTANTILIGAPDNSANVADELLESLDATEYCVMRVDIEDESAAEKLANKRYITKGKAALLLDLNNEKNNIDENRLFRLSANDIALLLQSKRIASDAITVSGTPLDGGYLSKEAVIQIAQKAAKLTPDKIVCELDSDGFKLIYNVMLYAGDKGAAYIIGAATGEIQWEFHGAANALRGELNKTHEQYGTASENTPPYQTTPNPVISNPDTTIISADAPTQIPATGFVAPTEKQPARSTEKSEPTTADPTTSPIAVPTERSDSRSPMDPSPSQIDYLTAEKWDELPSLSSIQIMSSERRISWVNLDSQPYLAYLLRTKDELQKYIDDYPAKSSDMKEYSAENFSDTALILVNTEEHYTGDYLNSVYFFRKGDTLYAGVFEQTSQSRGDRLDSPRRVQQHLTVSQKDIVGIKEIKTVLLTYEDVFGSGLYQLYKSKNGSGHIIAHSWGDELPETGLLPGKDLRNVIEDGTTKFVTTRSNATLYEHSAALIKNQDQLTKYFSTFNTSSGALQFTPAGLFRDHVWLITTSVEPNSNSRTYYPVFWKQNGILYVGFINESSTSISNEVSLNPVVTTSYYRFPIEDMKDVDRVEILHLKGVTGKTGPEYKLVFP